ncbi:hypothetical protein Tco_1578287 [Tanacetum coccineum]
MVTSLIDCNNFVYTDSDGARGGCKFQILELNSLIEKKRDILKTLENLDYTFTRFKGVLKIEDALTRLKVIEYEGNQNWVFLQTYIPGTNLPEQNHDLALEPLDGTLELRNAKVIVSFTPPPNHSRSKSAPNSDDARGDILKTLENLDYTFRRFEGVLKIEDALTRLEVIEYEGNQIWVSLQTYIPGTDWLEQNHELDVEPLDGTLELRNAEKMMCILVKTLPSHLCKLLHHL